MNMLHCRGCFSESLRIIYDFGRQPLAGQFPIKPQSSSAVPVFPLALSQCRTCGLLQIESMPAIGEIFHEDYRYSSSTVPSLVNHFENYAETLSELVQPGGRILEFGCNDGVLLKCLTNRGYDCVGIDASENVAAMAREKGLTVHTGFMTAELIRSHKLEGQFDLVTCSNVLAHIESLRATIAATRAALKPGGLFSIEVHNANELLNQVQFDTIYHEHQSYFSELTLRRAIEAEGFGFLACEKTDMHGGGLRLLCQSQTVLPLAHPLAEDEQVSSDGFTEAIVRSAEVIHEVAEKFGKLDAYGAAGRSQMFINMTNTAEHFRQVFDDSPLRQGRYIVGTDIPIKAAAADKSRACVILAWNYAPSIYERIKSEYELVFTVLPNFKEW